MCPSKKSSSRFPLMSPPRSPISSRPKTPLPSSESAHASSCSMRPAANAAPTIAPIEQPATTSGTIPWSVRARITPTCAHPRAEPLPSANPSLGRGTIVVGFDARRYARFSISIGVPPLPTVNRRARSFEPGEPGDSIERSDVRGLIALGAGRDIERYFLIFPQALVSAVTLDGREVRKNIFAAPVGRDETKTFTVVEPLNDTCTHVYNSIEEIMGLRPKRGIFKGDRR